MDPFQITKFDVSCHSQEIKDEFDNLEGKTVTVAGRMMSKRIMGKASFCHVQDLEGTIQCYVAKDSIGEESYADFKKYDIGLKCGFFVNKPVIILYFVFYIWNKEI